MKSYIEIIIQTILAFFSLLFTARLLGRQQVSQLTFHEYVNGITFGSIAANLASDLDNDTMQHFVCLILFGLLTGLISYISLKNRSFLKIVEGEPVIVIQKGKILEKNLSRLRYSIDNLNLLLRQNGCSTAKDVEYALLEPNGQLSVFLKAKKKPVTLEDLNLTSKPDTIPTELIIGGQVIYENLRKKQLTGKDLMKLLKQYQIKNINEVMYATIDERSVLYVDKYKDNLKQNKDISENNQYV